MGGWLGGAAGEMENKAISASNLKLKLKLTEAELGNIFFAEIFIVDKTRPRKDLIFFHV